MREHSLLYRSIPRVERDNDDSTIDEALKMMMRLFKCKAWRQIIYRIIDI